MNPPLFQLILKVIFNYNRNTTYSHFPFYYVRQLMFWRPTNIKPLLAHQILPQALPPHLRDIPVAMRTENCPPENIQLDKKTQNQYKTWLSINNNFQLHLITPWWAYDIWSSKSENLPPRHHIMWNNLPLFVRSELLAMMAVTTITTAAFSDPVASLVATSTDEKNAFATASGVILEKAVLFSAGVIQSLRSQVNLPSQLVHYQTVMPALFMGLQCIALDILLHDPVYAGLTFLGLGIFPRPEVIAPIGFLGGLAFAGAVSQRVEPYINALFNKDKKTSDPNQT